MAYPMVQCGPKMMFQTAQIMGFQSAGQLPIVAQNIYADTVNSRYDKSQSHYVNVNQRITQTIAGKIYEQQIVSDGVAEFKRRNPNIQKWSDIALCKPGKTTLDKIVIDTTLQRVLDLMWALNILDEFNPVAVAPISVYEDKEMPGKYICWDGQHTSVALMLILSLVLGQKPEECEIPINIFPSDSKGEMREMFIGHNSNFKKPLEEYDFWEQMVYGVRTDGNQKPNWVEVEQKQQWIESAKMFVTAHKNGDINKPGAISRLSEVMNRKYDTQVTYWFTKYFVALNRSNRAAQPKEMWMLYDYIQLCLKDTKIKVDDEYIRSVARALKVVGANDFDAGEFYNTAKEAYKEDYANRSSYHNLLGISYPEYRIGLTFLIAQLKKAGVQVPRYSKELVEWKITNRDLY